MISKPLFKQSCKANATIWTFVTSITCVMIAIIILVLGNLNVGTIRDSMVDMFVENAIESSVSKQSMTYFNMTENALENYDENTQKLNYLFNVSLISNRDSIVDSYNGLISSGYSHNEAISYISTGKEESEVLAIKTLLDYYAIQGANYGENYISEYVLKTIEDTIYNELIETEGKETADNAKLFISQAITDYLTQKSQTNYNATEFASSYIPVVLKGVFIEQTFEYNGDTIAISDYFSAEKIQEKSSDAICLFRAQSDIKYNQLVEEVKAENPEIAGDDESVEQIVATRLNQYILDYINEASGGLLEDLPEDVSEALMELGEMDVYSLVIGSIFYRIAGLLLPIIYVIMCANNLISSQVDSGSMAYILSTPTKRKTVTFTQILFLITSIFAMCSLTTITSVVCLAIVGSSEVTTTFSQLLLFNLGEFITLVAISGICFLASCWFNRSKQAMSIGGGLSMFFLVSTILGLFGSEVIPSAIRIEAMNYFNYVSIISLFDTISIIDGTLTFLWKWAILLVIAGVTYTVGVIKFNKKDLPL